MKSLPETACKCWACREACRRTPCTATPADAKALIDAGFKDRLELYFFQDILFGQPFLWPYLSGRKEEKGCTFFTADELCELHDKKLKPSEGRFAHHATPDEGLKKWLCFQWCSPLGIEVMENFGAPPEVIHILRTIMYNRK